MNIVLSVINMSLLLAQLALAFRAFMNLKKYMFDFAVIVELMYIVWFVPIVYDMMNGCTLFPYTYSVAKEYNIDASYATLTYYNFISTFIMIGFEMGYSLKRKQTVPTFIYEVEGIFKQNRYFLLQFIWIAIIALMTYGMIKQYDGTFIKFFLASNKKNVKTSVYLQYLMMVLPQVLLANYLLKRKSSNKKLSAEVCIYLLIMVLAIIPSGQRRDIVCEFLFAAVMLILFLFNTSQLSSIRQIKQKVKKLKTKFVAMFGFCVALIPILWYMRSMSNQIQTKGQVVNRFGRSVGELIFGSGATGFPTMIALDNFCKDYDCNFYLRNVLFLLESWIPRRIFPEKMMVITEYMQEVSAIDSNLSLFYIGDIYFTFGVFSIIVSFFVGYILSYLFNSNLRNGTFQGTAYACLMFSQVLLFFKNGLCGYIIMFIFMNVIFALNFAVLNPNGGPIRVQLKKMKIIFTRNKRSENTQ